MNLASKKTTWQSSHPGVYGVPSKAIDGNVDTCAETFRSGNPWWAVDLRGEYEVHNVIITNRGDCLR